MPGSEKAYEIVAARPVGPDRSGSPEFGRDVVHSIVDSLQTFEILVVNAKTGTVTGEGLFEGLDEFDEGERVGI
jgi:hypothetical protein